MRIGIMGGTFNPIHLGHLILAENAYHQLDLDTVWFMPSGKPPHKSGKEILEDEHRLHMVSLAIKDVPYFELSLEEIHRKGITYTVDTLQDLHKKRPEDTFIFLAGADSLYQLDTWREPEKILSLCEFAAANRDSVKYPDISAQARYISEKYQTIVHLIRMPEIDLSSSDIRERLAEDRTIRFLVPEAVEEYLLDLKAYR